MSLLRETVKSNGKPFAIASKKVEWAKNITLAIVGGANSKKISKELIPKIGQRVLRAITLQETKEEIQYCYSFIGKMMKPKVIRIWVHQ